MEFPVFVYTRNLPFTFEMGHEMDPEEGTLTQEPVASPTIPTVISGDSCPRYQLNDALQTRATENFSPVVRKLSNLITLSPEGILPVGSARFSVHKYPSDVDIFEQVKSCCYLNEVRLNLQARIRAIVSRVIKEEYIFVGDFKAGFDKRYETYFGQEHEGQIKDYNSDLARFQIDNLFNQGLLDPEEANSLRALIPLQPSLEEYTELTNELKKKYILRWNEAELLQGYKELPYGAKKLLSEALSDRSVVKMDLWAPIPYEEMSEEALADFAERWRDPPTRFVEVTNWILLKLHQDGQSQLLTEDLPNYAKSIRADVFTYLMEEHFNPLKASKRYWSYLLMKQKTLTKRVGELSKKSDKKNPSVQQLTEVNNQIVRLAPLFGSYIAFLNSVKGDLDLWLQLYPREDLAIDDNYLQMTLDSIFTRFRFKTGGCEFNLDTYQGLADLADECLDEYSRTGNPAILTQWSQAAQAYIQEATVDYLKSRQINIKQTLQTL